MYFVCGKFHCSVYMLNVYRAIVNAYKRGCYSGIAMLACVISLDPTISLFSGLILSLSMLLFGKEMSSW